MSSTPRRILLVRLSHLGDVVHALPVYHALRRGFPEARIAWAVQPEFAELIEALPGLTRAFHFDRRAGWRAWPRLARELRAFDADWTVDVQGNLKSAAVTWLSRAPRRSGWHRDDWRERLGARVLDDPAPPCGPEERHAIDRSLHLARHLVPDADTLLPADWLELGEVERTTGRKLWRERFGEDLSGPVVVQLAAPGDVRAWPVDSQIALLRALSERGRDVLALSGPGEAELGARLERELADSPRVRHWVGQRGLRKLAGFLRAGAEHGARFVSCDSGPQHVAAASGLPVVGLAGPQDARRTGPWPTPGPSSAHKVVRAGEALECAPCLARRCRLPEGPLCMERLAVGAVLEALED